MLIDLKKPVVVPDLNYLQSLSNGSEYLSAKCFWLWPRTLFLECADRGERSIGYLNKLLRIFKINNKRCGVSGSILDFCNADTLRFDQLTWDLIIDYDLTQAIGAAANSGETSRLHKHLLKINQDASSRFNTFWTLLSYNKMTCDSILTETDRFLESIENDRRKITSQNAIDHFNRLVDALDARRPPDEMPSIEDETPLMSFWKLLLYIRLRWDAKPLTQSELNDYDDLHYAILSSITTNIATNDKALSRMIRVCFPHVNFYPSTQILKSA